MSKVRSRIVLSGVSVVIAARNEESLIGATIASAKAAGADEVIVVDGSSTDATAAIARDHGARVIAAPPMRARQLNLGAREAGNGTIIFLHADTTLPPGAAQSVSTSNAIFGGFRLRFDGGVVLAVVAAAINLRTAITRCPWGDQAQFVRRADFFEAGGYREIPIMEDYDLARRMRRRGPTAVLREKVTTSGRRFRHRGVIRTILTNWRIIIAWHRGVDPETLARWYRDSRA